MFKNKSKYRVAMYCRVGSEKQLFCEGMKVVIYARSTTNNGLAKQLKNALDYCDEKKYIVVDVKLEICKGKLYFRRKLNSAIGNKEADAIVVSDISRISRWGDVAYKLVKRIYDNRKFLIASNLGREVAQNSENYIGMPLLYKKKK